MKKYVNAKNVIGLILGLLAIVVFCILKHPVWAILIGITTTVAFWVPNSKILDWVKAGLVTVAIGMTIYTIMQVEPIHTSIANAFPAFSGFLPFAGQFLQQSSHFSGPGEVKSITMRRAQKRRKIP